MISALRQQQQQQEGCGDGRRGVMTVAMSWQR